MTLDPAWFNWLGWLTLGIGIIFWDWKVVLAGIIWIIIGSYQKEPEKEVLK
jgi:hypothetical protein